MVPERPDTSNLSRGTVVGTGEGLKVRILGLKHQLGKRRPLNRLATPETHSVGVPTLHQQESIIVLLVDRKLVATRPYTPSCSCQHHLFLARPTV